MQTLTRQPPAHAQYSATSAHSTPVPSNLSSESSEMEGRAALLAFAWNIRDIVSSNISMFEAFTPNQMKEFAVNMANAFERFTVELEAVTFERDAARRELQECTLLVRERERISLQLATALAQAHAKIATQINSLEVQVQALSTALVLNSSCIMSVILPKTGNQNLCPIIHGDGSFQPLAVTLSIPKFPWPVSNFCVSSICTHTHKYTHTKFHTYTHKYIQLPSALSCLILPTRDFLPSPPSFESHSISSVLTSVAMQLLQAEHHYPISFSKVSFQ
jgi:hypothetical protein